MEFTEIQTKRNSRTAACHSGARKKCADYSQISVMRMSFLRRLQLRLKCRRKDAVKIAIAPRDQANGQILLRGDRPCRFRAERIQPGGKPIGTHCRWRQHRQRGNVMPHRSAAARVNHMRLHRAVIIDKKNCGNRRKWRAPARPARPPPHAACAATDAQRRPATVAAAD